MATQFDPARRIEITADGIAWFRCSRAGWDNGEAGTPAITPAGLSVDDYLSNLLVYPPALSPEPVARRLGPILCEVFPNATFAPCVYTLDPPARPDEAGPSPLGPDVTAGWIEVRRDHIALLRHSS